MSFDLEVWSVRPAGNGHFASSAGWRADAQCWSLERHKGVLQVWKSDIVRAEDIPDGIDGALAGIAFLTRITAAGELTKSFLAKAGKAGKDLARACHGVVFDPQTGNLSTPAGVKRFLPTLSEATFPITELSWWTLECEPFGPEGVRATVALLERLLPEALPRRYGLWEPPQHIYTPTGREASAEFLHNHVQEVVVWYPARPVLAVHLQATKRPGPTRLGFRANRMSIAVEASVLAQPGWQAQLRRVWHELAKRLRPFYGDVRTLAGYRRGAAIGSGTELHPVDRSWWRGLPSAPASAVVLGPDYQRHWPGFLAAAALKDGLAFLESAGWKGPAAYAVPPRLTQPALSPAVWPLRLDAPMADRGLYADVWPFEGPLSGA